MLHRIILFLHAVLIVFLLLDFLFSILKAYREDFNFEWRRIPLRLKKGSICRKMTLWGGFLEHNHTIVFPKININIKILNMFLFIF